MSSEFQMRISLYRVFASVALCLLMIAVKYLFLGEKLIAALYNYLITDIVFLR